MQVENIECQIAQAQIGNFLAGSGLSEEAMSQLEEHIAGCSNCKAVLSEKRSELKAMLTKEKAVVDFDAIHEEAQSMQPKTIANALRKQKLQTMVEPTPRPEPEVAYAAVAAAAVRTQTVTPAAKKEAPKAKYNWKPLVYSAALGSVLVGMSLFSNNLASIFGPKASTIAANTVAPATDSVAKPEPVKEEAKPVTTDVKPIEPTTSPITTPPGMTPGSDVIKPVDTPEVKPEEPTVTPVEGTTGSSLGSTAGALATTQFEAVEEPVKVTAPPVAPPKAEVVTKPAVKTPVKPVITKAPARRVINRRRTQVRKPVRRVVAKKAGVRSRGIKVYQP